jgi:hypothetical protein
LAGYVQILCRCQIVTHRPRIGNGNGRAGCVENFSVPSDPYSDFLPETSSADTREVTYIGGPVQTRTVDLLRVNRFQDRNSLILGASAAPKSTRSHPKSMFSTIVNTIKTQKEEVAEEVKSGLLQQYLYLCIFEVMNVSRARKGSLEELSPIVLRQSVCGVMLGSITGLHMLRQDPEASIRVSFSSRSLFQVGVLKHP